MPELTYTGVAPFFSAEDKAEILAGVNEILQSGRLTQGEYLKAFENAGAAMAGTRQAVAVNSGGMALELVLVALELDGGEVLVPTNTFVASASSVVRAGGKPVFVDVKPEDLAVSIGSMRSRLTPYTRGVMLVHFFGLMSPRIPAVRDFCREHDLWLIEDAAHAHGARAGRQGAGSLGIAGCFSYYATKMITTGEGGLITTNDDKLAAQIRSLRDHGRGPSGLDFTRVSNNFRLAEIPALLGVVQQRRLDEVIRHRRAVARVYREVLQASDGVVPIDPKPGAGHVYWRYAALLDKNIDRMRVQAEMAERHRVRVTWMYEPLCHQQPVYAAGRKIDEDFPAAVEIIGRLLTLPTHKGVDLRAARNIAKGLRQVVGERVLV